VTIYNEVYLGDQRNEDGVNNESFGNGVCIISVLTRLATDAPLISTSTMMMK